MTHAATPTDRQKTYQQLANNLYMHLPSKKKDELMKQYRLEGGPMDDFLVNHFWWILNQFDPHTVELTEIVINEMWKDLDEYHRDAIMKRTDDPISYCIRFPQNCIYPPPVGGDFE